jgi:hypothetical protein
MKVRVSYRSRGWGRVRPVFHVWLSGDYVVAIGGVKFRCALKKYILTEVVKGRKYTYYRSTVDCRSCRLLCEALRRHRPTEVELIKPIQLRL